MERRSSSHFFSGKPFPISPHSLNSRMSASSSIRAYFMSASKSCLCLWCSWPFSFPCSHVTLYQHRRMSPASSAGLTTLLSTISTSEESGLSALLSALDPRNIAFVFSYDGLVLRFVLQQKLDTKLLRNMYACLHEFISAMSNP